MIPNRTGENVNDLARINIDEGTLKAVRVITDYSFNTGWWTNANQNKKEHVNSLVKIHVRNMKFIWMLNTRKSKKKVKTKEGERKVEARVEACLEVEAKIVYSKVN